MHVKNLPRASKCVACFYWHNTLCDQILKPSHLDKQSKTWFGNWPTKLHTSPHSSKKSWQGNDNVCISWEHHQLFCEHILWELMAYIHHNVWSIIISTWFNTDWFIDNNGEVTGFLGSLKISPCEERRLKETQNLICENRRFQNCLVLKTEDLTTNPAKSEDWRFEFLTGKIWLLSVINWEEGSWWFLPNNYIFRVLTPLDYGWDCMGGWWRRQRDMDIQTITCHKQTRASVGLPILSLFQLLSDFIVAKFHRLFTVILIIWYTIAHHDLAKFSVVIFSHSNQPRRLLTSTTIT